MTRLITRFFACLAVALAGWSLPDSLRAEVREWTDVTGTITQRGELVDFDDTLVVLKKGDGRLVALKLEDLSEADRAYLATREAKREVDEAASPDRTWKLLDGTEIHGRVTSYGWHDLVIERRAERILIDGTPAETLTPLHLELVPKIVAHLEQKPTIGNMQNVESLVIANRGPLRYRLEGVVLETPQGDVFTVPFFLFSQRDLRVLEPGWKEFLAAVEDEQRQREQSTMLRALANEYQRQREIDHQIQMLQLTRDWWDFWSVTLIAPNGLVTSVMVPGRTSLQAQLAALEQCPGCRIGPTYRIPKRWD
jgi:hypothetical protein